MIQNCITIDASSTDCAIQVVDNPTLDLFLGLILFTVWAWCVIFWFKKR